MKQLRLTFLISPQNLTGNPTEVSFDSANKQPTANTMICIGKATGSTTAYGSGMWEAEGVYAALNFVINWKNNLFIIKSTKAVN